MSVDLRKSVTDAGYIAVGVGVLGVQQAATRRRELQDRFAASPLHNLSDATLQLRLKFKANLDHAAELASDWTTDLRKRAKPVVDEVSDRVETLPGPLPKVVEPAVKVAKQQIGRASCRERV